ncbi:NAD-dependent epimerase/dehydratase family protein [Nocardia brasiliensis]|uniref:NAD-dependent epimerase/dehydratase family protein n=1 Tax=Nocardia brasiliensis TaxID=37326 RepID=UPI001895E801|nr:NAD-dependent epimerase/dehydratase family protein [Nocardia brasiliensis]MBF6125214.1 NAD-dependent epimerase/dehydratase family protein [Nocardia brasiliensis]
MRVLVTGAAGFLGTQVRAAAAAAGHEVIGIDLMLDAVHGPNAEPPEGVSQVDVRDGVALAPLLAGIDVVCHLAAVSAGSPADMATHNDLGTAALLGAMEQAKVRRLVLASSITVYGEGRYRSVRGGPFFPGLRRRADLDRGLFDHRAPRTGEVLTWEPVGEDAPLRPRGSYGASKAAQENYAFAWGLGVGGAVTALRLHQIYGDGARTGLVGQLRAALDEGRAPHVFEDGGQVRDFVHVRDATAAVLAAIERALPGFVPLNIASGWPITLWELASIMAKARGGQPPVVTGQYRIADVRHFVADIERAKRTLGFAPKTPPAKGLAEFATAQATAATGG